MTFSFADTKTGELQERRLQQREGAEKLYRDLATQGVKVRVGMEASGHARGIPLPAARAPDTPATAVAQKRGG